MTSRNTWISPPADSSTNPIQIPLTLTTIEDSTIAPLMHRPSNEFVNNNNNSNNNNNNKVVLADSLDVADECAHINAVDTPGDFIRVISVESDTASSNSPPLSPTLDNGKICCGAKFEFSVFANTPVYVRN